MDEPVDVSANVLALANAAAQQSRDRGGSIVLIAICAPVGLGLSMVAIDTSEYQNDTEIMDRIREHLVSTREHGKAANALFGAKRWAKG